MPEPINSVPATELADDQLVEVDMVVTRVRRPLPWGRVRELVDELRADGVDVSVNVRPVKHD